MPPIPSVWHWHSLIARHAKSLKAAATRVAKALDNQLVASTNASEARLEHVLIRNTQPKHPLARIRQSQSRWYSTSRGASRTFTSSASGKSSGPRFDRSSFPKSRVGSFINQSTGRAPFASTLRPNLTGGALNRTAGGYTHAGPNGARYFSHSPASQAQVISNVSQAIRCFLTQGHKAQYDGVSANGEKRFKAVTILQEETGRKLRSLPQATPGSRLDFAVNPTITALTPLTGLIGFSGEESMQVEHLNTSGLLDVLSVDFSRALKDLAAVINDLKRLSSLGDLPITYEGSAIRVHFPGCDAQTVDRLCDELGVSRGRIIQDEDFDSFTGTEIALLFPFAPSKAVSEEDCASLYYEEPACLQKQTPLFPSRQRQNLGFDDLYSPSTASDLAYSTQSDSGEDVLYDIEQFTPSSGFETVRSGSGSGSLYGSARDPLEYQGFEGIYRFIEELDSVRR